MVLAEPAHSTSTHSPTLLTVSLSHCLTVSQSYNYRYTNFNTLSSPSSPTIRHSSTGEGHPGVEFRHLVPMTIHERILTVEAVKY